MPAKSTLLADKIDMDIMGIARDGMRSAAGSLEKSAGKIAKAADPASADAIDLSSEMVALLDARNQFRTNARVIQTADEMQKTTLNLLA
jgi:flagellar hook protein FlgE